MAAPRSPSLLQLCDSTAHRSKPFQAPSKARLATVKSRRVSLVANGLSESALATRGGGEEGPSCEPRLLEARESRDGVGEELIAVEGKEVDERPSWERSRRRGSSALARVDGEAKSEVAVAL